MNITTFKQTLKWNRQNYIKKRITQKYQSGDYTLQNQEVIKERTQLLRT